MDRGEARADPAFLKRVGKIFGKRVSPSELVSKAGGAGGRVPLEKILKD